MQRVLVNGQEATPIDKDLTQWQIEIDATAGAQELEAHAEDAAGNVERRPHVVVIPLAPRPRAA
ncbi:MAG: hypothetical protein JWN70_1746 [Planctomycetaceae bacterium]|nr:hypothetical protein [Planctomycetaceae bacterium]